MLGALFSAIVDDVPPVEAPEIVGDGSGHSAARGIIHALWNNELPETRRESPNSARFLANPHKPCWHSNCGCIHSLEDPMTAPRTACLGLLSVFMLSCSSVAPVKVALGDQCFRCRRPILNERVATETIDTNGFVSKYRGPGCMAKYLVAHPDQKATIFVTDFTSGKMMGPDAMFYVQDVVDRNTGETDYRAFRAQADADKAAADLHTSPVRWNTVLDKAH